MQFCEGPKPINCQGTSNKLPETACLHRKTMETAVHIEHVFAFDVGYHALHCMHSIMLLTKVLKWSNVAMVSYPYF